MTTPETSPGAPRAARPDADLVARIADRDEAALAVLYDRFAGTLLAIGTRILGSAGEAEDVVQEVFLQVWRQAGRYDPARASVSGWLSLITRSRAIDRLRNRRVGERTATDAYAERPESDASPEGATNVLFAERRTRIAEALRDLPAEQREVIQLAFFEGLTQNEIAVRTATPLGTVKTRTLLALKKLRNALREELEGLL
jgi:RNA polymerase sigma-70 factor (ECF subfamily)